MNITRCFGSGAKQELYAHYHDNEWGRPVYDDNKLFEMLILEGAQAGLSFETILNKRENYKQVFYNFDPEQVSKMTDSELNELMNYSGIIRNRLKIYSARSNAQVFLAMQAEFGSFSNFLWAYVDGKPKLNSFASLKDLPTSSAESVEISKLLKKRGMKFVGPTIIYAYMQAIGMVNDHLTSCFLYTPTD